MKDLLRCPPSLPPFFSRGESPSPCTQPSRVSEQKEGGRPAAERSRNPAPPLGKHFVPIFLHPRPRPSLPLFHRSSSPGPSSVARSAMNISWLVPSSLYFLPPPSILFNLRARPVVRPPRRSAPGDKFLHLRLLLRMVSGSTPTGQNHFFVIFENADKKIVILMFLLCPNKSCRVRTAVRPEWTLYSFAAPSFFIRVQFH